MSKQALSKVLNSMGPEAKAFWSKKEKGPQGQPSPYEAALSISGKVNDLKTTLLATWMDLGFPF
jgi:hypothetical protein